MTISKRLIQHISSCDKLRSSITVTDESIRCILCKQAFLFSAPQFIRDFLKHTTDQLHRKNYGWFVERDDTKLGYCFRTTQVKKPIVQYFSSSQSVSLDTETETPGIYTGPQQDDISDVIDDDVVSSAPETDSSQELKSVQSEKSRSQMCQTDNYVSFSDSSSQTARLSENDRDAVIKEFYLSMGFSLRHDFEVENIKRYYNQHPIAKQFTENGFSRSVAQDRHSEAVKTYVAAAALKHSMSSSLQWSRALGGPLKSNIKPS